MPLLAKTHELSGPPVNGRGRPGTLAACAAVDQHEGLTEPPWFELRWEVQLREARQGLGSGRGRRRTAARR